MRLMQFSVLAFGLMLVSRVSAEDRIAKWLRAIDDGDAETRIEAIDRLAAQDWSPNSAQAAVIRPRLEPLLQDADLKVRGAVAYAYLAVRGQPELVESLLSQPDLGVAVSAAKALLAYTDRVEQPVAILAEAYARVNFDLAGSFLHMSPALARRVAHELLSLAEKDHDDLEQDQLPIRRAHWFILAALPELDAVHAPRLLKLSESSNRFHAEYATSLMARDLARLPEVQVALARLLNHTNSTVRQSAAVGLLSVTPDDARAWRVLSELLRSKYDDVSRAAAIALGDSGLSGRSVLTELFHGLIHEDRQHRVLFDDPLKHAGPSVVPDLMRFVAEQEKARKFPTGAWEQVFWILSHFGPAAISAMPVIERHVDRGNHDAIETLCKVGRDDERLLAPCLGVLKHGDERDRNKLIASLLETPPTIPAVREQLRIALSHLPKSTAPAVCMDVLRLRKRLGEEPDIITKGLIVELARAGGEHREFALKVSELLEDLGPAAAPALRGHLDQWLAKFPKDSSGSAVTALAALGSAAVPFLIDKLKDERPFVRDQACWALSEIGPQASGAVEALTALLDDEGLSRADDSEPVWLHAACALGEIGPSARPALPRLWERLNAPHRHAPSYVLGAVARIGGPADELLTHIQPYLDHRTPNLRALAVQIAIRAAPERPETRWIVEDYIRRLRHDGLRNGYSGFFSEVQMDIEGLVQALVDEPEVGRQAIPELQRLFDAPFLGTRARCEAAFALAKLDPHNSPPLDYLKRLSRKRHLDERIDAEEALEKLGIPRPDNER